MFSLCRFLPSRLLRLSTHIRALFAARITSFRTYVNPTLLPEVLERVEILSLCRSAHIHTHKSGAGDPFVSLFQRPRTDPIEEGQRDNGYGRGTWFPPLDASECTWDPMELSFFFLLDFRKERGKEREADTIENNGRMIRVNFNSFPFRNSISSDNTYLLPRAYDSWVIVH